MPKRLVQLILVATILRMIVALFLEFGNDEAYYFLYALNLQPNYFDHPPGIALLIRVFTLNLTLTDEFFVRLGPIVCAGIGTWLTYRLGTLLKNEQTGWFAAILYTASIYTSLLAGTFIIPDSPQVVAWLASLLVMHSILTLPESQPVPIRSWLLFGLLAGVTILCKVHGVFLWASLGGYIIFFQRKRLTSPGIYLSAAVTAVVISPILIWNIQNDFITYRFHSERLDAQGAWIHLDYFFQTVLGQLLYGNPVNSALVILALWKLKTMRYLSQESLRFVLFNGVPLVAVVSFMSLFNPMLPHWSGPGFMVLTFLAAAYLDEKMVTSGNVGEPRILRFSAFTIGAMLLVAVLVVQVYPGTFGSLNKSKFGDDDFTLDLYGWRRFSRSFESWLSEEEKLGNIPRNLPLVVNKWFPGAHIEYYVARPLDKTVIGVGRVEDLHQYVWLNQLRPPLKSGENALAIVPSNYQVNLADSYYQNFGSAELLKVFYSYRGGSMARYFTVYLLKDYQANDEAHREIPTRVD